MQIEKIHCSKHFIGLSGDYIFFSVFWGNVPLVRSPFLNVKISNSFGEFFGWRNLTYLCKYYLFLYSLVLDFFVNTMAFGWLVKVARFLFQEISRRKGRCFQETLGDVLELSRGRLYPLFSGNNDISLCKGSKCRDDC